MRADAIAQLVTGLGGRCATGVALGSGRHVYVLFAAPLPWRELRDLAPAMALRFPAEDVAPMNSLGGQISPPGSRHKSGGWRVLARPPEDAGAAAGRPSVPQVWNALLAEFAAEPRRGETTGRSAGGEAAERDDVGVPWVPRLGGRAPLGAGLEHVARTGQWDRSRYRGRSEARMAVLTAAAARGWRLTDVRAAVASGAWRGRAAGAMWCRCRGRSAAGARRPPGGKPGGNQEGDRVGVGVGGRGWRGESGGWLLSMAGSRSPDNPR